MPRKARVVSKTNIYHVMLRGVNQQIIFEDEQHFRYFISILSMCRDICGYTIFAYCLMNNHIHLLMEEGTEPLSIVFKRICDRYVYWYNHKYERMGHLFQDRFRSEPVETERYFLIVIRYIFQNPVKAGIVEHPEDYPWSSYRTMLGMNDDKMTDIRRTLAYFRGNAVMRYRDFVEDIGHKYVIQENEIKKSIGEDDLWLPW